MFDSPVIIALVAFAAFKVLEVGARFAARHAWAALEARAAAAASPRVSLQDFEWLVSRIPPPAPFLRYTAELSYKTGPEPSYRIGLCPTNCTTAYDYAGAFDAIRNSEIDPLIFRADAEVDYSDRQNFAKLAAKVAEWRTVHAPPSALRRLLGRFRVQPAYNPAAFCYKMPKGGLQDDEPWPPAREPRAGGRLPQAARRPGPGPAEAGARPLGKQPPSYAAFVFGNSEAAGAVAASAAATKAAELRAADRWTAADVQLPEH